MTHEAFPFCRAVFRDGGFLDFPGAAYESLLRAMSSGCLAVEIELPGGAVSAVSVQEIQNLGLYRTPAEREAVLRWAAARKEFEEGLIDEIFPEPDPEWA